MVMAADTGATRGTLAPYNRRAVQHSRTKADEYLAQYPDLERWINVCSACGLRGYKPDLPENIYPHFNIAARNLRKMLCPLDLNETGICELCAHALEMVRSSND